MVFLLSHVDKSEEQIKEEKAMMAADVSANADESSSINEGETIAYDKDQLYQQLTTGGGKVLDNFDLHEAMSADLCLLISDSHQRSLKYFYSLAGGVPCVSHIWVRDCCKMEKRLPYHSYVLPAGISLTRQHLIEWHSRHNVLRLLKVCVSSKNKKYVETWSSVLEVAGCVVKDASMTFEPGVVNFVLADASIASHVKSSAIDLGIPIVSSEWVIQCLINGQRLPYDAHEKFQHDYHED
ncbi:hypothetical protein CAPTEDRAFT_19900 [Capitella teleta]|uniref:BRCT domain-containing protein n=1 Tax=Capitella teleta TaxID=283909 RepID=R7URF6_CAPTE|nr:hypothetical protein CAPTEDRAFT_19900 [Capitella teleta]|eukprot:ELU05991.1 hypothetical protein CAPTEDRAFT_19900 [Capitella teleta]